MKCPICGNENNCFIDLGKDPDYCWCKTLIFPSTLPETDSCICESCVRELLTKELTKEVRDTEKQFMLDSKEFGADGWSKYFLTDGFMVSPGHSENTIGPENILKVMSNAFVDGFELTWEPDTIGFSDDFSMCYSTGKYVRVMHGEVGKGKFMTIWRRTKDGWKIQLDIGN